MSVNVTLQSGNLGQAPDVRTTQGGTKVANLSLAVEERYQGKDGNWTERTHWFDVTVWGKQAEACERYLDKGSKVFVKGELQQDRWEDQEGNKRSKVKIKAHNVEFLSPPRQQQEQQPRPGYVNGPAEDTNVPF